MINNWLNLKIYINDKKINTIITRKETPENITKSSFDHYCVDLTILHILEKVGPGNYKILQHIPQKMNTIILHLLLNEKEHWKKWFILIEDRVENFF